ncbi:MAG TPA: SDR family oxidoreductase, partial [Capillimicrobium sp.]|nr:SDR family oxidoreductase [Capillimicrobium sp.]
ARVAAADLAAPGDAPATAHLAGDVTSPADAERLIAEAADALGGLDALVLAAGIHWAGPTHEMEPDAFRRVLDVNVTGTFLCCRAALPRFLEQGSGHIVTLGSTASLGGAPGLTAYSASKGAVLNLTRSIAVEYARAGVRANCLCPGSTMTPLMERLMAERANPQEFADKHPIGRFAEPDEIAAAAAFLLSGDASFFVGSAVVVDGGFTAA